MATRSKSSAPTPDRQPPLSPGAQGSPPPCCHSSAFLKLKRKGTARGNPRKADRQPKQPDNPREQNEKPKGSL